MSGALGQLQFRARRCLYKLETQQTAGIHPCESSYKKRSQTVSLASP